MNNKRMKIVLFGNPVLRQSAKPVTVFHKKLHSTIDSMAYTLNLCNDGAALAANQVGILKRVIVINYENECLEMINPEIMDSDGHQTDYEGCLSYPGYFGHVTRSEHIKVKYMTRQGNEKIIERTGKLARCIQHETDHLDGILFIDRMSEQYLVDADGEKKIGLPKALELARDMKFRNK